MFPFPPSFQKLVSELSKLPSIGEKSATRLAYYLVQSNKSLAHSLSSSLVHACDSIRECERCFFFTEDTLCRFCQDPGRDQSMLCIVEKPMDIIAFEKMGEFHGLYHVLHGLWAPLKGQGPESMKLAELVIRVKQSSFKELVIATSSTVEGDATALYIANQLEAFEGLQVTRLAQGMPKGGELEYSDEVTLSRALSGRSALGG